MGLFDSVNCDVKIALKYGSFFPGNLVEGVVILTVSKPVPAVAVRVKVVGKEKVSITQGSGDSQTTYTETTRFLKHMLTLVGHTKASGCRDATTISPGEYSYPFSFHLPPVAPASFRIPYSGDVAAVLYYVKAYVDIPHGRDAKAKHHFHVVAGMPRMQWASAEPVATERSFDVSCCCFSRGHVQGRFWLDRSIVALDRDSVIHVCVDIDNTLGEEAVQSVELTVVNDLRLSAQGYTNHNRRAVAHTFLRQRVEKGQCGRVTGEITVNPTLTASAIVYNIQSIHMVQMELNIPKAFDPSVDCGPICVVQFVDDFDRLPPYVVAPCPLPAMPRRVVHEFVYTPPADPVYAYTPYSFHEPLDAPAYPTAPPATPFLPPQGVGIAPLGLPDEHVATGIAFGPGCAMQELPPPLGVVTVSQPAAPAVPPPPPGKPMGWPDDALASSPYG